jgi:hypothetical protein
MANSPYRRMPSRNAAASENAKIARLRDQRIAREAALREAGTWGEMSVGEIVHEPTGDVFVISWKGNKPPDLARLLRIRLPDLTLPEHERLQDWLSLYDEPEFRQSLIGWSLSRVEAKRAKEERIAQHRASGRRVVNDPPPAA